MNTMTMRSKAYRLEIGALGGGPRDKRACPKLHLVHANDQETDDDFDGRRNLAFVLVLLSAGLAGLAGLSMSAVVWSMI